MHLSPRLVIAILTILYIGLAVTTMLTIISPELETTWKWISVILYGIAGTSYVILLLRSDNKL